MNRCGDDVGSPTGSIPTRSNPTGCKLYICVREDVPDFITPTLE